MRILKGAFKIFYTFYPFMEPLWASSGISDISAVAGWDNERIYVNSALDIRQFTQNWF